MALNRKTAPVPRPGGGNLAPANAKKVCAEQHALPKGMSKKDMPQDGNCLFRAAAYCSSKLTKSELIDHHQLRAECVSRLRKHDQRYIHDWDGEMLDGAKADSFDTYCNAMAKPKTWGSSFELQAIARMYDTKFVVFPQSPHREVFAVHAQQKEAKHSPKMMMVEWTSLGMPLVPLCRCQTHCGTGLWCSFGSPPAPSQWSRPPRQTRTPC